MIDIAVLTASIAQLTPTISTLWNIAQEFTTHRVSPKDKVVVTLEEQTKALREQVSSVSKIGNMLDDYIRLLIQALEAHEACKRLQDYSHDNQRHLQDPKQASYDEYWRIVDLLTENVNRASAENIRVILNRVTFLDDADATAIRLWVDQFNKAHARALSEKNAKRLRELQQYAEEMVNATSCMRELFENTIFEKMTSSLKKIGDSFHV